MSLAEINDIWARVDKYNEDIKAKAYKKGYEQGKADAIKWIPVSERLPEMSEDILILLDDYKNMSVGHYDITDGEWYADVPFYDVVAWMPLPKPYKEGKEDGRTD